MALDWDDLDLPQEVIEDLLFCDMEELDTNDRSREDLGHKTVPAPILQRASTILHQVNPNFTLTEYGEIKVQQWIQEFAKKAESSVVVQHYATFCTHASDFFCESKEKNQAPKLLLDVMRRIATPQIEEYALVDGEIRKYESDTLEYIGGYVIKKALVRFPTDIIDCLRNETPHGSLISLMERKAGALIYPSEELLLFLQHVYLKFSREASRNPTQIQFTNAADEVMRGQYYSSFVTRILGMCEDGADEAGVEEVAAYVTKLVVRILSYSFARKLFARLHERVTNGAIALRGQLQGIDKPSSMKSVSETPSASGKTIHLVHEGL